MHELYNAQDTQVDALKNVQCRIIMYYIRSITIFSVNIITLFFLNLYIYIYIYIYIVYVSYVL